MRSKDLIQLVFRRKPYFKPYLRALPRTAYEPTEAQIRARLRFAELAKKAKGMKFTGELPPAAELVKQMKGERFGRKRKKRKWEEILERWLEYGEVERYTPRPVRRDKEVRLVET